MDVVNAVIICNCLIAIACCWVAWKLWQVKQVLSLTTRVVTRWERQVFEAMATAPANVLSLHNQVQQWQLTYQQLAIHYHQLQQALALLGLLRAWWRSGWYPFQGNRR
ncbi:MAG: hypothetical protein NZ772_17985 [Cyanobacteria bacterium]|nr:hypothetical protein [Cyanobacteriota bacterium]MDW8203167.1 hypothetical protein [Cyanobacteriota bacterium SKYGB_h_bin112]